MNVRKMLALSRAVGRNDIEKVQSLCNAALAANRHDLMALMMLADTHWRTQNPQGALTAALKALEVEPSEFYALRIVAGVYAERGEHDSAYPYARRLMGADTPYFPPTKTISRFLAPFAWLPRIRQLRERVGRDGTETRSSHTEWLQWASGYVAWYESRSQSAP